MNFIFLMFRMVNISSCNALSKFESLVLGYKEGTEFKFLCFVNKARTMLHVYCLHMCSIAISFKLMLLSSVDDIIYKQIE